jgi:hypothetical protein
VEVEDQNGDEHEHAADHGIDEKFDGGVDPALGVAPDPDQQVHGNEHDFPEDVEKEKVEGHKNPDHPRFQEEEADHELFDLLLDILPAGEDRDDGEKSRGEPGKATPPTQEIKIPGIWDPGTLSTNRMAGVSSRNWKRAEKRNSRRP